MGLDSTGYCQFGFQICLQTRAWSAKANSSTAISRASQVLLGWQLIQANYYNVVHVILNLAVAPPPNNPKCMKSGSPNRRFEIDPRDREPINHARIRWGLEMQLPRRNGERKTEKEKEKETLFKEQLSNFITV